MNLISLIFAIFNKFVPISDNEFAKLKNEAEEWQTKAFYEPESSEEDKREKLQVLYCRIHRHWWVRMAFAAAYLPLVNYFMNMGRDQEDEE